VGRRKKPELTPLTVISLIAAICSIISFQLFILDKLGLLPFQLFPWSTGYEGPYATFEGIIMNYDGKRIVYRLGEPKPSEINPSSWTFAADHFNVDPDAPADGWQNFKGHVDVVARPMLNRFGGWISDPVTWEKTYVEEDKEITKKFEARIYYFETYLYFDTHVDESVVWGAGTTEKGSPIRDTIVPIRIHIEKWSPKGNNTEQSFAAILGVEVTEVNKYFFDKQGNKVEGYGPGSVTRLSFFKGQMLAMYPNWESFISQRATSSQNPEEILTKLKQEQPDISPSPSLRKDVIVALGFDEFGAKDPTCGGGVCGWGGEWSEPGVEVKLTIHVLAVDSWICVRHRATTPEPPPNVYTGVLPHLKFIEDLANWIGDTFGLPFNVALWIAVFIFLFALFLIAMIIVMAVAIRLGVRGRDIREYRESIRVMKGGLNG